MSIGGSSNLGTLLIRRLDTALSVQASQQSQIVNAARADAIAQLADAARINPVHNEGGRPLQESIDKAQAQTEHHARQPVESGKIRQPQADLRLARPSVDTAATPSAPTSLGHTARAILALLNLFPDHAPPLRGRHPLIQSAPAGAAAPAVSTTGASSGGPTTSAAQGGAPAPAASSTAAMAATAGANAAASLPGPLVQALSLALQQSGAFYESHLQTLAFGGRTAAQLRQEPQGRLSQATQNTASLPAGAAQDNAAPAARAGGPGAEAAVAEGRGATATQANTASSPALAGMHADAQPIVRQQLEILATQVFNWRGEAWPDAPMDWEIARQDEEGLPDEAGTHWATSLRLTLPSLGRVEARLSLHGKQVVMRLVAPQSAQTLAQHDRALRAGFQEAGLTLSQLNILEAEQS